MTMHCLGWSVHDNYTKTDWPVHDDALPGLVCEWQLHQDCWPVHDDALAGLVCAWQLHQDWLTCAWRCTGWAGLCMTTMPRLTDLCMTMHWLGWSVHDNYAKTDWPVHDDALTGLTDLCMTMHWLGWSRLAMSYSLMIILETRAFTEFMVQLKHVRQDRLETAGNMGIRKANWGKKQRKEITNPALS